MRISDWSSDVCSSDLLTQDERARIESQMAADGRSMAEVLEEASETLSGLSRCAGLVLAPTLGDPLKHIAFVSLGPGRAPVVLITVSGGVDNRISDAIGRAAWRGSGGIIRVTARGRRPLNKKKTT